MNENNLIKDLFYPNMFFFPFDELFILHIMQDFFNFFMRKFLLNQSYGKFSLVFC